VITLSTGMFVYVIVMVTVVGLSVGFGIMCEIARRDMRRFREAQNELWAAQISLIRELALQRGIELPDWYGRAVSEVRDAG
jgi:hypothetical protein